MSGVVLFRTKDRSKFFGMMSTASVVAAAVWTALAYHIKTTLDLLNSSPDAPEGPSRKHYAAYALPVLPLAGLSLVLGTRLYFRSYVQCLNYLPALSSVEVFTYSFWGRVSAPRLVSAHDLTFRPVSPAAKYQPFSCGDDFTNYLLDLSEGEFPDRPLYDALLRDPTSLRRMTAAAVKTTLKQQKEEKKKEKNK